MKKQSNFEVKSPYQPAGDQPKAIEVLTKSILNGNRYQTLAAQLYSEFREFFPNTHVEYFVSYYDYYQPEAYTHNSLVA